MRLRPIVRITGAVWVLTVLSGCVDVGLDLVVDTETSGIATTTIEMDAEAYPRLRQMNLYAGIAAQKQALQAGQSPSTVPTVGGTCTEPGQTLTENADGSAICTIVQKGDLGAIVGDDGDSRVKVITKGVVRISIAAADIRDAIATMSSAVDAKVGAEIAEALQGDVLTIRIRGQKITETNMTLGTDGRSAETVIPLSSLITNTVQLPDAYFAVVDTN